MRILAIRSRADLREYARNAKDSAFFRALREPHAWVVDLRDLLDREVGTLRRGLRDWFAGPEFQRILEEASRA